MTINELLAPQPGARLAVVGCGGKTTFVNKIAVANRKKRVLILPTTKIRPPYETGVVLCETLEACLAHRPQQGLQCFGLWDAQSGKLSALPSKFQAQLSKDYDLVLMEADGSRGLPCKGWAQYEPVVPNFTTITIGIVTLLALGKAADDSTVHRLPEFTQLTGVSQGQAISLATLAAMVARPDGMFKNAHGKRVLLLNHIEDAVAMENARALAALLRKEYPALLDAIYAGSLLEENWLKL